MGTSSAKKIGQRLALKSGVFGIAIAYIIFGGLIYSWDMKLVQSIFWIFDVDFWYHLLIGATGLLTMCYYFGGIAGIDILVKKKNEVWTGIKYGFLILITGTLIGSSVGFIEEGIDNIGTHDDPFFDYYFKPLYWITIFGTIPVLLVGIWFGKQIKKREIL